MVERYKFKHEMRNMANVRVRGIYSTALSYLLMSHGFKIVEASEKIRSRLNIDFDTTPCSVTVKDTDNPDEILVIGTPLDASRALEVIVRELKYVVKWTSRVDLYGIYSGRVVDRQGDRCIVDIGVDRGILHPCREFTNAIVIVGVAKAPLKPGDSLLLTRNFRLIGKYLAIIHDQPKITFSEHIRDHEIRSRLSAIAMRKLIGTGIGIHFRSSSKYASDEEIEREIDELISEYRRLLSRKEEPTEPGKIREGEFIGIIALTSLAKRILDEIRRQTTYTIYNHHSLKSLGLSEYVDLLEEVFHDMVKDTETSLRSGLIRYILKKTIEIGKVEFIHSKPTGEILKLSPGRLIRYIQEENELKMIIKREIRSDGVYDGLGIEKRSGDIDYVVVHIDKPYIVHNYFRDKQWLGSYININTPPEIGPGIVKYHDLIVDIAVYTDGSIKLIDTDEFNKHCEENHLSRDLCLLAEEIVNEIIRAPLNYVYNPYMNQESK